MEGRREPSPSASTSRGKHGSRLPTTGSDPNPTCTEYEICAQAVWLSSWRKDELAMLPSRQSALALLAEQVHTEGVKPGGG